MGLNKKTLSLLGIVVIVIILPLALFLATHPQVLRQKASETSVLRLIDVSGNELPDRVTSEVVYLNLRLPTNWQIENSTSQTRL